MDRHSLGVGAGKKPAADPLPFSSRPAAPARAGRPPSGPRLPALFAALERAVPWRTCAEDGQADAAEFAVGTRCLEGGGCQCAVPRSGPMAGPRGSHHVQGVGQARHSPARLGRPVASAAARAAAGWPVPPAAAAAAVARVRAPGRREPECPPCGGVAPVGCRPCPGALR